MYSPYRQQTFADILELAPFSGIMPQLPPGFIPPGYINPNYIPPNRGPWLLFVTVISCIIIYPLSFWRFWVRARSTGLGIDDWAMVAAMVSNRRICACLYKRLYLIFLMFRLHLYLSQYSQ